MHDRGAQHRAQLSRLRSTHGVGRACLGLGVGLGLGLGLGFGFGFAAYHGLLPSGQPEEGAPQALLLVGLARHEDGLGLGLGLGFGRS